MTSTARTWAWHAVPLRDGSEQIELSARAARTHFVAQLKPADALKLIEELTNALEELDIEVVRIERKRG